MGAIGLPIIAAFLIAALGAAGQRLRQWISRRMRLGHLYALFAQAQQVRIVIPGFPIEDFQVEGSTAKIPPNVPVMPMAEGGAVAQLVRGMHEIGQTNIALISSTNYQDDCDLTISVGGPSVNPISGALLAESFPRFALRYPEHVAAYGTTTFSPNKLADGSLSEDYGFIACARTANGHRFVVLCGVWAPGTQIATSALLEQERKSQLASLLIGGRNFFAVAHGKVTGLEIAGVSIIEVRRSTDDNA